MLKYTILFPNIGALQGGDPVMVNGVKMGTVGKIYLQGTKVAVLIRLDKSVLLTDSARVAVQNIGLMGERTVGIRLSDKGTPLQPNDKRGERETYLNGYFETGIAEAMGMMGILLGEVQILLGNVQEIVDNTIGDPSFVSFFHSVVARLDTLSRLAESLVAENKNRIDQSLSNVQGITTEIRRLLQDNQGNINALLANGADLSERAVRIATDIESVSASLRSMISSIERGEGSLGMLMGDEKLYEDLKGTLGRVDTLLSDVQDEGLKLRIKFGFRKRKNKSDE